MFDAAGRKTRDGSGLSDLQNKWAPVTKLWFELEARCVSHVLNLVCT